MAGWLSVPTWYVSLHSSGKTGGSHSASSGQHTFSARALSLSAASSCLGVSCCMLAGRLFSFSFSFSLSFFFSFSKAWDSIEGQHNTQSLLHDMTWQGVWRPQVVNLGVHCYDKIHTPCLLAQALGTSWNGVGAIPQAPWQLGRLAECVRPPLEPLPRLLPRNTTGSPRAAHPRWGHAGSSVQHIIHRPRLQVQGVWQLDQGGSGIRKALSPSSQLYVRR